MSFSNYTAQAVLNTLFGKTSNFGNLGSRPSIYLALSTTAPTEAGANVTEPVGGNYSRKLTAPADWGSATLADPSEISNAVEIAFPTASGAWGTCTHIVAFDAASNGNVIASVALGTARAPISGDTPTFAIGAIKFTLD